MKQLVWLDLCSGLGGASQPALDRGWKVIRVDIDPRFKPDIVADVRALSLKPFHVDVLWASPPCQEFSKFGLRCFFPNPPEPDLSIAFAIRETIAEMRPRFWVIENVGASRPWLTGFFGPVRARPAGHVLWSNLGFLLPQLEPHKGSLNHSVVSRKRWGPIGHHNRKEYPLNDKSAQQAAVIPYEIGEAICGAVERRAEAAA